MKKFFAVLVALVIATMSFGLVAMAMTETPLPTVKDPAYADVYASNGGFVYAIDYAFENGTRLEDPSMIGKATNLTGFVNGFIVVEADWDFVPGVKEIREQSVLLGRSTINFVKIDVVTSGFNKLPEEWQLFLKAYGMDWPKALLDETLFYDGESYVSHEAKIYDSRTNFLVGRYYFGRGANEYMGVFFDTEKDGFVLCKAVNCTDENAPTPPGDDKPPKPTPTPSDKPTDKPTPTPTPSDKPTDKPTPTPTPTSKPTATPVVTPEPEITARPTATPKVTPEPERPADNDDGGYGDNPLKDLDVKPVATPVVTAEPEKPADNQDGGGHGSNPLQDLHVDPIDHGDGGYGGNPLTGAQNVKETAKPVVQPSAEQPIQQSTQSTQSQSAAPKAGADAEAPIGSSGSSGSSAQPAVKPAKEEPVTAPASQGNPLGGSEAKPVSKPAAEEEVVVIPPSSGNPLDNGDGGYSDNPLG